MKKSRVYFTKEINPESLIKLYETLGVNLPGKREYEMINID